MLEMSSVLQTWAVHIEELKIKEDTHRNHKVERVREGRGGGA